MGLPPTNATPSRTTKKCLFQMMLGTEILLRIVFFLLLFLYVMSESTLVFCSVSRARFLKLFPNSLLALTRGGFFKQNLEQITSKSRAKLQLIIGKLELVATLSKSRGLPGLKNPSPISKLCH